MILQQAVTLLCLCAIGLASPSWAAFPGQKLRISIDASVIPNDVSEETLHLLEQVLAEVQIEARTEENSADLKKAFEIYVEAIKKLDEVVDLSEYIFLGT